MRAIYGALWLDREVCPDCDEYAFVIDGKMACCGAARQSRSNGLHRETLAHGKRRSPSVAERLSILSSQHDRCLYCGSVFGDFAVRNAETRRLNPCFDHVEPFAWQSNNQLLNFVAACSICNGIKGSKMFETISEAIAYVWHRRKKKGWKTATEESPDSPLRELWRTIPQKA